MNCELWTRDEFVRQLRRIGERAYHDKHPFHLAMNQGRLAPPQLRGWIANRFYYQQNIPVKDAAILSNCPERDVRRLWIHRILDHDGQAADEGGIEAWMKLGAAAGLSREALFSGQHLVPGARFAVDAYVNFARSKPWPIAIASSLTELFAPDLMATRLGAFEKFYTWIDPAGLQYFRRRLTQARRDSDEALTITVEHCDTPQLQREAVRALEFKCDVLWALLDAIAQHDWLGDAAAGKTEETAPRNENELAPTGEVECATTDQHLNAPLRPVLAAGVRLHLDGKGRATLLFPEGILELNETAHQVLRLCDGRSLGEIISALAQEYDSDQETISVDVRETIKQLRERRLLEFR